jgi:hypothetical protein
MGSLLAALVVAMACASTPQDSADSASTEWAVDTSLVDCQLPAKVRKRGRNFTYVVNGEVVRISAAECAERGGFPL